MRKFRTTFVLVALTGLVSMGLVTPAHALPVFTASDTDAGNSYSNNSAVPCTLSNLAGTTPTNDTPVVENGPATTVVQSNSGRLSLDSAPATDYIDFASSLTSKTKVSSAGGNPASVTLDLAGSVQASASLGTSACSVGFYTFADLEADFSVADAGFFLYDYDASKYNYAEIYLEGQSGNTTELDMYSEQARWKGAGRVFLTPGTYEVFMEGDAWVNGLSTTLAPTPVNVNLHLKYAKAGSVLVAAKGKAKSYVEFPAARSCGSENVSLKVKKAKASKVKSIQFLLNGKVVKTIKKPKGNEVANLKAAAGADATVVTKVVLKPKKKGAKPVRLESSASYLACS